MGEHSVQFYEDETFLMERVCNYVAPALRNGHASIVIALPSRLNRLDCMLAEQDVSLDGYVAVNAETMLEGISVDGRLDEELFRKLISPIIERTRHGGLRNIYIYGEMVAMLCDRGDRDAAIRLEDMWNRLAEIHDFSLLCTYPINAFSDDVHSNNFQSICHAHGHVHPTETAGASHGRSEEMHRTIALLQQKTAALEAEADRRERIQQRLHQREQELSDFLENALEGMHRVGPDGRIIWANQAELDLFGYSREEYIGHHIAEFHADANVIADILQRLRRGDALYDFPARIHCKDGSIRHVLIHSNAFVSEGEFVSTRCLTRDVTERVRLEEELHRKLAELADLDRRKDEFLAMLGHELRNPLAPVLTSLELMRLHESDLTEIRRLRGIISRQVDLITRLVDDLLDVSRITHGKIELQREFVQLNHVIESAVEIATPLIDERRHHLSLNLLEEPVVLHADPARLAQAIANLLHNAAKYTEPGGSICITSRREDASIALAISDSGIGLEPEMRNKVFDLFVQGSASPSDTRDGLGLGLTLVRSLVQMHGGSVDACSEGRGCGSVFTIKLPLPLRQQQPAPTGMAFLEKQGNSRSANVLIVDDNIDAADSLAEFLKALGHTIHVAYDGRSAIDAASRIRPETVILDIGMPDMSGYQVAQLLRSEIGLTSLTLIAVSGYAQESDRMAARAAGFDHHFAKPLDIPRLTALLNQSG